MTTSYTTILYSSADGIAQITLNRPEKYNAITATLITELTDAFKSATKDTAVRVVILSGAGKGFCSGQDLNEIETKGSQISLGDHLRQTYNPLLRAMRGMEKPILGALNGVAAGAGSSLALACDLRIMADNASLVLAAFAGIGLLPDSGATWLLPRLVGTHRAMELLLLADGKHRIDAQKSLDLGLCTAVVPADQLNAEALEIAKRLAELPPMAVGMTKRALLRTWDLTFEEGLEMEAQLQEVLGRTPEHRARVDAFLKK
jgi:2-(1,2-epoxy-1,2-dihydrophenyl)acetyl-CoA isomerase